MGELREKFVEQLDAEINKAILGPARELVQACARESIQISSTGPDEYLEVGKSRFGGDPDLPADFEWPKHESYEGGLKSSNFICQVNMAELPKLHCDHRLPTQGILYLFVGYMESAAAPAFVDSYFLETVPDNLERRNSPPNDQLLDEYLINLKPNKVSFSIGFDCDTHDRELLKQIDAICAGETGQDETPSQRFRSMCFELPCSGSIGQMLGYANTADKSDNLRRQVALSLLKQRQYQFSDYWDSMEEYEATVENWKTNEQLSKMYQQMRPGVEWLLKNKDEVANAANSLQHLIQIHSNRDMDMWINDADPMYVFIDKDALAAHDFSKLPCEVTQG